MSGTIILPKSAVKEANREAKEKNTKKMMDYWTEDNSQYLYLYHDYYYLSLSPLPSISKGLLRPGIEVGTIKKGIFYPSHSLYRANSLRPYFKKVIDLSLDEYLKYRQGLSLFKDVSDGFYLLTYQDLSLGFSKASKGELKNKYPKGLRF